VQPQATFCFEACDRGPTVQIGEQVLHHCTYEQALDAIEAALALRQRRMGAEA
jgi:NADH:ubiquinone oxidoreductase subunit E